MREILERSFQAYGAPLKILTAFKYMGRVMTSGYDDWPAVAVNLHKARKGWGRMLQILIREGADPKVSGHFFMTVVQAVLMFGTDT